MLALIGPLVVISMVYGLIWSTGVAHAVVPDGLFTPAALASMLGSGLGLSCALAIGEEIGFRGYLLPRLMQLGTTRALLLSGLLHAIWHFPLMPSGGSATIFGQDSVRDSVAIREKVGYLAQDPRYYDHLTARETLRFTARFFYSGPKAAIENRIAETLDLVGLTDKADRPIKGFSGGERQRLGIAQAQVNQPDLLILDEPAADRLDQRERQPNCCPDAGASDQQREAGVAGAAQRARLHEQHRPERLRQR